MPLVCAKLGATIRRGTISALGRWRRRHTFLPNPAISWKVVFDFFRHTVGTAHSEILSEAGHCRPERFFRFLYQRLADAELHRWETYLEHRVQAKGWEGPTLRRTLRHLPSSVPQPHRWFLLTSTRSHYVCQTGCSASR